MPSQKNNLEIILPIKKNIWKWHARITKHSNVMYQALKFYSKPPNADNRIKRLIIRVLHFSLEYFRNEKKINNSASNQQNHTQLFDCTWVFRQWCKLFWSNQPKKPLVTWAHWMNACVFVAALVLQIACPLSLSICQITPSRSVWCQWILAHPIIQRHRFY